MARNAGLDLVEVATTTRPIVCKIMDYGRFRFEQEKKAREAKKQQHQVDIKEVKYRPNINIHDFETKTNKARKFLEQGKHVKVTIMFRMREMRRPENGFELLKRVAEALQDVAKLEQHARPARRSRSDHVDAAAQEIGRSNPRTNHPRFARVFHRRAAGVFNQEGPRCRGIAPSQMGRGFRG